MSAGALWTHDKRNAVTQIVQYSPLQRPPLLHQSYHAEPQTQMETDIHMHAPAKAYYTTDPYMLVSTQRVCQPSKSSIIIYRE